MKDTVRAKKFATQGRIKGQAFHHYLEQYGFCYELTWAALKTWEERYSLLLQDIDRYFGKPFGVRASVEKRPVSSFVLKKVGDGDILKSSADKPSEWVQAKVYYSRKKSVRDFVTFLEYRIFARNPTPFFDETGIDFPVDLTVSYLKPDINSINLELKKYGLAFVTEDRNADVLVVRDR